MNLTRDYNGAYGSRIHFDKDLTIDGQGHTLNCLNEGGCSAFYSNSGTITLKNLRIINGHNDNTDMGGAIYITGSAQYTLENCIFENNWADDYGGAIYNAVNKPLTITNCQFISNKADDESGGAIYSKGVVNIVNSTFNSNQAYVDGGAIYSERKVDVDGCVFKSNKAHGAIINSCEGGAIFCDNDIIVNNCTFSNNAAENNGGAIYTTGNLNIDGCTFEYNTADNNYGGAIYCKGNLNVNLSIFKNNKAHVDGGAIFCEGVTTVTSSRLNNNRAQGSALRCFGGAIRSKGACYIIGSEFCGNFAEDYGGAIYADGILSIVGCDYSCNPKDRVIALFSDNSAINYGGAIYVGDTLYINWQTNNLQSDINDEINGNLSTDIDIVQINLNKVSEDDGGAIYCCGNEYINSADINSNSTLVDGGGIFCKGETYIKNSVINSNHAVGAKIRCYGGAIRSKGNCYIDTSTLQTNVADNRGGAIYADKDLILIGDCHFESNHVQDYGGFAYVVGSVYINWNLENSRKVSFYNDYAIEHDGGAIYCCGNAYLNIAEFDQCWAGIDGGAIFSEGETHVKNTMFFLNSAKPAHLADFHFQYGGAIYSNGFLTVEDSTFGINRADNRGGAIYADGDMIVSDSIFYYNEATEDYGGAIYADGDISVSGCIFEDNYAHTHGGAIFAENLEQLSNSQFIRNDVDTDDGGAIYINSICDPNIVSCLFSYNSCGDEGGAIYLDKVYSDLKISYCVFVGNRAGDKGQAVYNCGDYDCVDYCWYGTNNPDFSDMFKIYHRIGSDDDYAVSNYAKINLKVNDTNLFVGNKYQLSAYFTSNTGSKLNGEIIGCDASFSGDGSFSNNKNGSNEITTDVIFTKEYPIVLAKIDKQSVYLSPDVINKYPSAVNILSCDDVIWPGSVKVNFGIINRNKASFEIKDNQGKIVKQGDIGDDEKSLVIAGLDPGSYSITISNSESFDRLPSSATANFKVKPLYNVVVSVNDVVYGEMTTITLKSDIDALFNVTVDKYGLIQMEVINGTATHQLKLNSGVYTTHTVIDDDNCTIKCTEASFTVRPIDVHVSLVVNDTFAYPNNITGEIITDYPGAYVIKDSYNYVLATVNITNKSAEFNVGVLRPGFHHINVFTTEPNYSGAGSAYIEVVRGNLEGYSLHILTLFIQRTLFQNLIVLWKIILLSKSVIIQDPYMLGNQVCL